MNSIDLNIFELEAFNASKSTHVMCIDKLNQDPKVQKYLGNLFYMIERINRRREDNFVDQIYIVYFHDKIIGFISISIIDDMPLISSALLKEYRGEAIGGLLLQNFTYYLQDYYNFEEIYLQIKDDNKVSQSVAKFVGYNHVSGENYSIKRNLTFR